MNFNVVACFGLAHVVLLCLDLSAMLPEAMEKRVLKAGFCKDEGMRVKRN
jgi:hypothetical protein